MTVMKILIVNPNSTASMTRKIETAAKNVCHRETEIIAVNPSDSPPSIEGHFDEVMSAKGLVDKVTWGESNGVDATLVACFDDPAIGACREVATGPVMGMCEAAMIAASVISTGFSVVTTLARSVSIIEDLAEKYGMHRRCRRVRAANLPVLALEENNSESYDRIRSEIQCSIEEDMIEAVILGCAGMADLTERLSKDTGVPVVDGVVAGVKLLEGLVGAGVATSKIGAYAQPRSK